MMASDSPTTPTHHQYPTGPYVGSTSIQDRDASSGFPVYSSLHRAISHAIHAASM